MTGSWEDAVAHFMAAGPIGVLTIDSTFDVAHANDASGSILGYHPAGVLRDPVDRDRRGSDERALPLDGFKAVNDQLGHDAGERALILVAERIRACSPPQAVIARLGGDEFAIVVPDDPGTVAEVLAQRLLTDVSRPLDLAGYGTVAVGVSIGVAATEGVAPVDPNDLVVAADDALRIAKGEGKGTWIRHRSRIDPSAGDGD